MAVQLDYFYGDEADQFSFYRVPKVLFNRTYYKGLGIEAKVLYGLMLDRMSLSLRNGWLDDQGRVYIYFTLEDAIDLIGCGHNKMVRIFKELETIGLIERKKQGLGKPAIIYVKNFISAPDLGDRTDEVPPAVPQNPVTAEPMQKGPVQCIQPSERAFQPPAPTYSPPDAELQPSQNRKSGLPDSSFFANRELQISPDRNPCLLENGSQDGPRGESNNTEINYTEINDTDNLSYPPIPPTEPEACTGSRGMDTRMDSTMEMMGIYRELIQENIEYDILVHDNPYDVELINGYVELMVETCCTRSGSIRVNKQYFPVAVVKSRFLKLTREHILYVLSCMKNNTTRIGNIKAYIISALYNAPVTMDQYYTSLVSYDNAQRVASG